MNLFIRFLGVAFILVATFVSLRFLQKAFDEGDLKRAQKAFHALNFNGQTVWQAMANEFKATLEDVKCQETLISRYQGPIRFDCVVATHPLNLFVWEVDVVGFRVTAKSELSQKLMNSNQGTP